MVFRWQKTGKTLITVSWLGLVLLSLQPVADALLLTTEKPYEKRYELITPSEVQQQELRYIVVLGGGFTYNPEWSPSANLISNSLPRVTEGVRLALRYPQATLILPAGGRKQYQQRRGRSASCAITGDPR